MASQADLLRTLPFELRHRVYSYLFPGGGDGTVRIEQKFQSDDELSPLLVVPEDPRYIAQYRGTSGDHGWPKEIDEAFFQGVRWISKEHPRREKLRGLWVSKEHLGSGEKRGVWRGNEIISQFIYESTGRKRHRKQVSNHMQFLRIYERGTTMTANKRGTLMMANEDPDASDSVESPTIFKQIPNPPSNPVSILDEYPPLHGDPIATDITRSLSLVNHFYRADCIGYLASNVRFDFRPDRQAFQRCCRTALAAMFALMRDVRITLVEGYMPPLPDWPNLCTLALGLWPRNPTRPDVDDRAWGAQTEELLASLGVTVAARARITLEMRWAADCERFEREYVGNGRWRRISADVVDVSVGRDEGFCQRFYGFCQWGERCGEFSTGGFDSHGL